MKPAYWTTGGIRHKIPYLRFTPSGVRKEAIEGYIAVGGLRKQWFSRGDILAGLYVDSAQPIYRLVVEPTGLTPVALNTTFSIGSGSTARLWGGMVRISSSQFYAVGLDIASGLHYLYRGTVSGGSVTFGAGRPYSPERSYVSHR